MAEPNSNSQGGFVNTNWASLQAGALGSEHAEVARDEICLNYRQPLYFYIRRKGHSPEDAEDLIQGFLFQFIFGTDFGALTPAKGPFRSFLLACLNNYLAKAHREQQAVKRGGRAITFSLNTEETEAEYLMEVAHAETPEVLFDRKWAQTILDRAWSRMQLDFERVDKAALFRELKAVVEGEHADGSLAVTAQRIGMTPEAFRKALERFRIQYHKEVRATVASDELADQETRFIQKALKS